MPAENIVEVHHLKKSVGQGEHELSILTGVELVELGGNDGLRGFQPQQTEQTLRQILQDVKAANAEPLLMQIRLPANYGRRYNEAFSAIYPKLAKEFDVPLLPFFMEEVYLKPQWMQDDGIHPNRDAQPFIADWMAKQLQPLVNHDS